MIIQLANEKIAIMKLLQHKLIEDFRNWDHGYLRK
jgi:hypothetical protein